MTIPKKTIADLLRVQYLKNPAGKVIFAPGRIPLTYSSLYSFINHIAEQLNALGLGRNDRIGIVLPNGPEMPESNLMNNSPNSIGKAQHLCDLWKNNDRAVKTTCQKPTEDVLLISARSENMQSLTLQRPAGKKSQPRV